MNKSKLILNFSLLILFFVSVSYIGFYHGSSNSSSKALDNSVTKQAITLKLMMDGLSQAHYQPQAIDDSFSNRVYTLYLKRLDYNKKFFLQSDINALSKYHYQIDDEVKNNSFQFYDLATTLYKKRTQEVETFMKEIIRKPFDFKRVDSIEFDPTKIPYCKDTAALKEAWRKYLKYQTMTRLASMLDAQEKAKTKKDSVVKIKSFAEMEKEARNKVAKSDSGLFEQWNQVDAQDRFSQFLNTIAGTYDPHTDYFAPKSKKNFDITMSGQLEGIGAQLQEKDGNIKVVRIIPGSPCWRQGELKAGDIILKVGQGSKEPEDVVGMRLDDAVELIRGKKGTEVRLTVKKVSGKIEVIPIIRDVVHLDETYAHSAIIDQGKKIGYIRLPIFYTDFDGTGARRCADDVKKEILKLKAEHVQGIIMDLRNNGGGSLQDVVKMVGLLIPKGPVVQARPRTGAPHILADNDTSVYYRGPFAVMVNGNSASASEIFAAAIQDYRRGVIVGGKTFGKGTVQQFFNLDDYVPLVYAKYRPLGSVKITIDKFYRINGGATQLKGVTPDIILPDAYQYVDSREKDQDYPLPWDKIDAASYTQWNHPPDLEKLRKEDKARVDTSRIFRLINEEANLFKKRKEDTKYTLNLKDYRETLKKRDAEMKKFDVIRDSIPQMKIHALKVDMKALQAQSDSAKIASDKAWFKSLDKDVELYETTNIIDDMK